MMFSPKRREEFFLQCFITMHFRLLRGARPVTRVWIGLVGIEELSSFQEMK